MMRNQNYFLMLHFYAYVQEVRSSIDDIAFRVARDFNEVQKNGKDLTGKIGSDMFLLGLPNIKKNFLAGSDANITIDQKESVVNFQKDIEYHVI